MTVQSVFKRYPFTVAEESRRMTNHSESILNGRVVQRIAFAPVIGCTAVKFTLSRRSATGLQLSEDSLNLISATLGEPDLTLFAAVRKSACNRAVRGVVSGKLPVFGVTFQ